MKILVVGDIGADATFYTETSRTTDEFGGGTSKPIHRSTEMLYTPGMAGNVAVQALSLGHEVLLTGLMDITDPSYAYLMGSSLRGGSLVPTHLWGYVTPVKMRVFSANTETKLRVDREAESYQDLLGASDVMKTQIDRILHSWTPDLVIISDYAKGTCTREVCQYLIKRSEGQIYVDPKGDDWGKYEGAHLIKANLSELGHLKQHKDFEHLLDHRISRLTCDFYCDVVVTRGPNRALFCSRDHPLTGSSEQPRPPEKFYDSVGAGDVFMVVLSTARHGGASLVEAVEMAMTAATESTGRPSTTPKEKEDG